MACLSILQALALADNEMSGTMRVKVLDIRLLPSIPERPLKGFADIEVFDGWVIRDFRIVIPNGYGGFVDPPQIFLKDFETGELKPKPILSIPNKAKQAIVAAILSAYREKTERRHEKKQESER